MSSLRPNQCVINSLEKGRNSIFNLVSHKNKSSSAALSHSFFMKRKLINEKNKVGSYSKECMHDKHHLDFVKH